MISREFAPQSFIIKIWIEEAAEEVGVVTWRGYITHVPSGKRKYVQDLDRITAFITEYLVEMGVEPLRFRPQGEDQGAAT